LQFVAQLDDDQAQLIVLFFGRVEAAGLPGHRPLGYHDFFEFLQDGLRGFW
jgi:hypothetical protein